MRTKPIAAKTARAAKAIPISREQAAILHDHQRLIRDTADRLNVILSTILAGHGIASVDLSSIRITGTDQEPTLSFSPTK